MVIGVDADVEAHHAGVELRLEGDGAGVGGEGDRADAEAGEIGGADGGVEGGVPAHFFADAVGEVVGVGGEGEGSGADGVKAAGGFAIADEDGLVVSCDGESEVLAVGGEDEGLLDDAVEGIADGLVVDEEIPGGAAASDVEKFFGGGGFVFAREEEGEGADVHFVERGWVLGGVDDGVPFVFDPGDEGELLGVVGEEEGVLEDAIVLGGLEGGGFGGEDLPAFFGEGGVVGDAGGVGGPGIPGEDAFEEARLVGFGVGFGGRRKGDPVFEELHGGAAALADDEEVAGVGGKGHEAAGGEVDTSVDGPFFAVDGDVPAEVFLVEGGDVLGIGGEDDGAAASAEAGDVLGVGDEGLRVFEDLPGGAGFHGVAEVLGVGGEEGGGEFGGGEAGLAVAEHADGREVLGLGGFLVVVGEIGGGHEAGVGGEGEVGVVGGDVDFETAGEVAELGGGGGEVLGLAADEDGEVAGGGVGGAGGEEGNETTEDTEGTETTGRGGENAVSRFFV